MTYQTNNPVGSVDVRDLYDNAEAFDNFSAGLLDAYPDRFGVQRQSLQGIRNAAKYQVLGPYAAGLVFTTNAQVFSYMGEFYAPGPAISLPYTTTGAGAGEIANFRSVGDATLRDDLAAPGGAKHVLGAVRYCDTIADMRLLLAREANDTVALAGSLAEAAPGQFYWSPSSTATDDGRSVVAVTGVATGRWLRAPVLTTMRNILEFIPATEWAAIAAGTSSYDCSAAIEMANTLKCVLYAPHGTYRFTQPFLVKHDSVGIVGEGWRSTVFEYTPGNVSAAIGNATPATTKLFTRFSDFLLSTPQALTSIQADGFQFSSWERVWVYGSGLAGSIGIDLFSTWAVTEATYNKFDHLYIGNTKTAGIRIRDGANTNLLTRVRCQPAGGAGFLLAQLTGAGRCQNNTLQSCSSEFPGNVSNGVQIGVGVTDTTVVGCRFESMNNGIGDEGVRTVAHEWGNYFDSCTRNKLGPTTTDQAPEVFGCCTFDGTGATGSKTPSHTRNLTATKTATGVYRVNWTVKPLNGASANVSSSADLTILTGQDADGITFSTQTVAKAAVDASRIVVTVHT